GTRVSNGPRALAGVSRGRSTESNEPGNTGRSHHSGRAELGRQNTTIGGLVPVAMKPIGRALGSDHRGRERVAALSVRTARNRRTRTRMSGGVGGGGSNPPADPISSLRVLTHTCKEYGHPVPGAAGQSSSFAAPWKYIRPRACRL